MMAVLVVFLFSILILSDLRMKLSSVRTTAGADEVLISRLMNIRPVFDIRKV
jgi:hypothetical protein